ncbi:hypothetical protein BJ994_000244 [Arthrobacter pigmenti]|uniref:Uncharacterized protein n=1 Tax=Arthrobacter pigmenti TaxID=271432 RepID=A0A846RDH3_9MICC|nr:hypothetical protein [Arthrobacter pigmenti]NJC21168.1 hypothetical protein [Arthrobacter pigmenti]
MSSFGTHARIVRAVATAVVVFFLAAGAHLAGGAALPSPLILAALAAATLLGVTVLARKKLPLPAVLGVLGFGQIALHQAFTTLTTTTACVPATRGHFGTQQVHCASSAAVEHLHAFAVFDSPLMFAAHTAAVAVTALMLYHGETALLLALHWFRPLAARPRLATFLPLADLPLIPAAPARSYLEPLLNIRPLRGPPLITSH